MNVLLISQCSKRALVETRRILDQFAERRGERTWQTAITLAGLDTLRKLLRRTARKNTAVACHWIHAKNHTELLWIVGDTRQFNTEAAVPTNTTTRDVLRRNDENDWHRLRLMRQLAALAALLHDMGKACEAFQLRLRPGAPKEKNRYRHEWISVRLFQAFVGRDDDVGWLRRLANAAQHEGEDTDFEAFWLDFGSGRLWRDGMDPDAVQHAPFGAGANSLPPLAQAVAWLVLTHHRLPTLPRSATETASSQLWHGRIIRSVSGAELSNVMSRITADWNEPWETKHEPDKAQSYWSFPAGLPVRTPLWRKRSARIARSMLQDLPMAADSLSDPFVMHLSRLILMLGDHYYSSLTEETHRVIGIPDYPLFANTDRATGACLQRLDEHLLGVERHAGQLTHGLPSLASQLSHLIGHRGLKRRSSNPLFQWQDKAVDLAVGVRRRAQDHGAFIVNMASTGCGKTLGNARIMNALADPQRGLRCAFAIGLRTLTLQTGRSFQCDLDLGDDELAIQVGGAASRELFEYYEQLAERSGSASRQALVDESTHVVFEGNDQHSVLQQLGNDGQARKLLAAPLLVCTVDHLTPATESLRGGRQIAPMLRLLTGDLVLDEPDDFDLADLPALTRLVYWAGLLGSRVLLSSATLPPALVEGLFMAYREGRVCYQKNRGQRPGELPHICSLWVDEFSQAHADCAGQDEFRQQHQAFVERRVSKLGKQAARRRMSLLPLPAGFQTFDKIERRRQFALTLRDAALQLHSHHHCIDPQSGKRVSFGLLRMANIDPLFDVALAFFRNGAPSGAIIHLCVYHSQFPLFLRSAIEHRLDTVLNRRNEMAVFDLPDVRRAIDGHVAEDQLFVVLGSPVTEVGRDHDYDWAVVEPSSMRSLIQLAGRVSRHRPNRIATACNVLVCDSNLRHFEQPGKPAFLRPGFESKGVTLHSHRLMDLLAPWLDEQQQMVVDARPRILPRPVNIRQPNGTLVDLEHTRLENMMLPSRRPVAPVHRNRLDKVMPEPSMSTELNASSCLREAAHLTGFLQQAQPFRDDAQPRVEVVLKPNEDDDDYALYRVASGNRKWQELYVRVENSLNHRVPDKAVRDGDRVVPWVVEQDVVASIESQAEDMGLDPARFAISFARVSLAESAHGWRWHPVLGFSRKE
ncbi:type I-F CRISPR-associated helicase Cas3f [Pusillimonas sp.]|uniref:type I-F CRISPR-associated helicase Cas3f n=1 Tax=Pusillimonas sp. TaxID=3040095 RepID=UPI0037CAB10A